MGRLVRGIHNWRCAELHPADRRGSGQAIGPGTGPLLDLACGTGIYGQTLTTLGWTPFGVDCPSASYGMHAGGCR
jgi:hypothetical protein